MDKPLMHPDQCPASASTPSPRGSAKSCSEQQALSSWLPAGHGAGHAPNHQKASGPDLPHPGPGRGKRLNTEREEGMSTEQP